MKNGYKNFRDYVYGTFPKLNFVLNGTQMHRSCESSYLGATNKMVPKSMRLSELQNELVQAKNLYAVATQVHNRWRETKKERDRYDPFMREFWEKDPKKAESFYQEDDALWVYTRIRVEEKRFSDDYEMLRNASERIWCNLYYAVENIERAIVAEQKGAAGEDEVERYLKKRLDCRILSGVILPGASPDAPKTAESDLIVFSRHGVFVCEIKNYGKAGQTLQVQPDGSIIKLDYSGRFLENMGSPFKQNEHHCAAVRNVLNDAGLGHLPVFPVVVIGNTEVNIQNATNHLVVDMYELADVLSGKGAGVSLSEIQLSEAYSAVKDKRMGERKFPVLAVSPIAADLNFAFQCLNYAYEQRNIWFEKIRPIVKDWEDKAYKEWQKSHRRLMDWANFTNGPLYITIASFGFWIVGFLLLVAYEDRGYGSAPVLPYLLLAFLFGLVVPLIEIGILAEKTMQEDGPVYRQIFFWSGIMLLTRIVLPFLGAWFFAVIGSGLI